MTHRLLTLVTTLLAATAAASAPARGEDFALRDGDTVAFLGDSITAARGYSRIVENYTLLRFPERKIRFTNVGRGGETAKGVLPRLDEAVFASGATVLTVAYGINDIGWGTKADEAHKREYLESLREIVQRCQEHKVRVWICSAAITAEAPETAEKSFLQTMCDEALAQAKAQGAGTIDMQRGMREVQRRVMASNERDKKAGKGGDATMHAPDGVHLNDLGQMAMAVTMLKAFHAPADVSWATIDARTGTATQADACHISDGTGGAAGVTFTRLDDRQPLNLQPLWGLAGFFMPLTDDLNRYGLTVNHLPEGKWDVLASGRRLGTWSTQQLAQGVNLASASAEPWEPGGPWHAQAQLLKTVTDLRDELEWANRDLRKNLTAHPDHGGLEKQASDIEAALVSFQHALAKPVPTAFEVRPAADKH